jgi:hypothetical protein
MSPKEYFSLLFKCFFKIESLGKEIEAWDENKKIKTSLWLSFFSGLLNLTIICICFILCYILHIPFNITEALKGCLLGSLLGFFFIVLMYRYAFSNFIGAVIGVNIVISIINGLGGGLIVDFIPNIALGFAFGLDVSIIYGVSFGIILSLFPFIKIKKLNVFTFIPFIGTLLGIVIMVLEIIIKGNDNSFINGLTFSISFMIVFAIFNGRFYYFVIKPLYKKTNPLWWDENIGLPVPFLPRILRGYAKIKDFDKTIEFAKFLIEERPVQREVAQKGLISIALDRMKGFNSLEQIQKLPQSLSFMPPAEQLTEGYNIELQTFISISNDLLKTNDELNYANRVAVYERTRTKLLDYRKAANLSNSPFAQDFGEVADAWQKVLTKTIDDLRAGGKLPIANPYTLGKALQADSDQFLGRRDLIQKIETETLREGAATALLFIGNRRTGKSSTLNNLQRFVQSAVRTVFADLQDAEVTNSTADFCETLTERIAKSLRIATPPEPIRDLAAFTKWLKQRDADLVRDNRYLLICIDEYERLEKVIKQGKLVDLPDSLRHWIQHLQHIVFLFAGSHEPSELKGDLDWTDYLINVRNVPISYLEYEAAMQLVTAPVPNFDLTWATDDLAHKLVLRLGRQPYLLQCTMWNLVENLNNQNRKEATQTDIDEALDKVLEGDARNHFSHFWDTEMTDATRSILSHLARNTQPTEGSVLNGLKRKEIVKLEDGVYVFCVPLLKEWILRNVDAD